MYMESNPFYDLYQTESLSEEQFVELFSPVFVEHSLELFSAGNVVLKGLQGSGKTMLLNLLKPEIRLAYHRSHEKFPVSGERANFISGGINLRKSGVSQFSQLLTSDSSDIFVTELALQFGDFVNLWIVDDLLRAIQLFNLDVNKELAVELGVCADSGTLEDFAAQYAADDCWFGGLNNVFSIESLRSRIAERITQYRRYINLNDTELSSEIRESKTVAGEPIIELVKYLRKFGVLGEKVNVFIRFDQYEELPSLDTSESLFGEKCQCVLHKFMASRDGRVSYRIGTRQYAWPDSPLIFATDASLEHKRDYSVVNIDNKLRRDENPKTWIFPKFAESIFTKRLKYAGYNVSGDSNNWLNKLFGTTPSGKEKAELLAPNVSSRKRLSFYSNTENKDWQSFLTELYCKDPLNAKFAEAWVEQKDKVKSDYMESFSTTEELPWESKKYWMKERIDQALAQIASRNKQKMYWCGKEDILGISGGNILVFLFISQHIWDVWLRENSSLKEGLFRIQRIDNDIQRIGIQNASEEWTRKPLEGSDSSERQRFVRMLGERYYQKLIDDSAMSYPGHNGFSISNEEMQIESSVVKFLKAMVDYGDLYEISHTSKSKGESRRKFYIAPILCPALRLTYKHIKEPEYVKMSSLLGLILGKKMLKPQQNRLSNSDFRQQDLFKDDKL